MTAVILTLHTIIVLGLIVVVLLQRSDGGALGLGGGGGGGGFMSGRGAANALTRTTSILAALFFATSLGLAVYSGSGEGEETVIEGLTGQPAPDPEDALTAPSTDDLLRTLGGDTEGPAATEPGALPLTEEEILDSLGASPDAPQDQPATTDTPADETPPGDNPEENQGAADGVDE
jgi:preprotein translocase subunit SecG